MVLGMLRMTPQVSLPHSLTKSLLVAGEAVFLKEVLGGELSQLARIIVGVEERNTSPQL